MTDFFDWLSATDAGALTERLATEFRLSQEEMRRTADALLPAFLLGFQRAMGDADAFARLVANAAPWLPTGAGAAHLPPKGPGEAFTHSLFGSDLSAAIARQASLLTGLAPDVLAKMMPALGALTFQSMLQTMATAAPGGTAGYPGDWAGQALAETMRRSANAVEAFHRPSGGDRHTGQPMQNLFADALRGFPWMGGLPQPAPGVPADPFGYLTLWSEGWARMVQGAAPTERKPSGAPGGDGVPGPFPLAGFLADAQARQADYIREMMALFERHGSTMGAPSRASR
ncbi:hypothetical protein [Aureimonas sp. ME7]|uniref:hypothetical protein n=1 Tax=Aureimonas sp. ME7 TaxID=2744252 RepID=UPI0015F777C5|nr:hypothetical protein [Aureimonas sp. ME7]